MRPFTNQERGNKGGQQDRQDMPIAVLGARIIRVVGTQQAHWNQRIPCLVGQVASLQHVLDSESCLNVLKAFYSKFGLCDDPVIRYKSRNCGPAKIR